MHFLEPSDEIADPYYVGVRLGIENRCRELKTEIVKVFHSDAMPEEHSWPVRRVSSSSASIQTKRSPGCASMAARRLRRFRSASDRPLDSVFSDVGLATHGKILDMLNASGYKRIGFIGSHEHLNGETLEFGERRCASLYRLAEGATGHSNPSCSRSVLQFVGQNLRLDTGYRLRGNLLALCQTGPM